MEKDVIKSFTFGKGEKVELKFAQGVKALVTPSQLNGLLGSVARMKSPSRKDLERLMSARRAYINGTLSS
ncbi:MAG: hypothetical protein WBK91_06125 [Alphaproteobacteria bacterium]